MDIKDFYLNSNLEDYECMFINVNLMPTKCTQDYDLNSISKNGKVLTEIRKGTCGLHQVGKIAYEDLKQHLKPYGCVPTKHAPGLWRYITTNLTVTLIVDDFGVKYENIEQVKHLIHALKQKYEITVDWAETLYAGVSLDWDYVKRTVKLSISGCIKKVLIKHAHPAPNRNQHSPRQPEPIVYGAHKSSTTLDTGKDLTKDEKLMFQSILGSLLCYGRMIDSAILTAINDLSISQTKATTTSRHHMNTLLDYFHTNPNASTLCRKADMIIKAHSDGSYLSVQGSRSRAAEHFY